MVTAICDADGSVLEAEPGMSVVMEVADDISIVRGDMLCRPNNRPAITQEHEAMLCWFDADSQLSLSKTYVLKHTTRQVRAKITSIRYRLDISTLHRDLDVTSLEMNDIARITLQTSEPLMSDSYDDNRRTGSFILIDESTCATVAAGMIR